MHHFILSKLGGGEFIKEFPMGKIGNGVNYMMTECWQRIQWEYKRLVRSIIVLLCR